MCTNFVNFTYSVNFMYRFPTNLFAQALKNISDASVSVTRLHDFFMLASVSQVSGVSDTNGENYERVRSGEACIRITNASFDWEYESDNEVIVSDKGKVYNPLNVPKDSPSRSSCCLSDITFSAVSGDLIAIVGAVGQLEL